jgi:transcription initiation factor TFIIIB Brf1 subunit/transcription initiation factor TFIIB
MTSKDKSISYGISFLKEIAERININDNTFNKACEILKKVDDSEVCKGSKINVKCATLMYLACK